MLIVPRAWHEGNAEKPGESARKREMLRIGIRARLSRQDLGVRRVEPSADAPLDARQAMRLVVQLMRQAWLGKRPSAITL